MDLNAQPSATAFNEPPEWSKTAIWYQIFVERFNNGDTRNDPGLSNIQVPGQMEPPKDWTITPWTKNWYSRQEWEKKMQKPFNETIQYRRYGGDLKGVIDKLDYLQDLGITALYINPINDAPSMHKYDAKNYHHIDVNFGPDPGGDNKMIAAENPADPTSWKWTSADKLFLQLVKEVRSINPNAFLIGEIWWEEWPDKLMNPAPYTKGDVFDAVMFYQAYRPARYTSQLATDAD